MKILIVFHTPINAGYAMSTLERVFFDTALALCNSEQNLYFAFQELNNEKSNSLPEYFDNYLEINPKQLQNKTLYDITASKIAHIGFDIALCFDLQVSSIVVDLLRAGNVKKIVSYWGASISGINNPVILLAKQIEVFLQRAKPDLFIFESRAMQNQALRGRGLPKALTKVIYNGVDLEKFAPTHARKKQYQEEFNLTLGKRLAIYSGHMEERKGVGVLVRALKYLVDHHKNDQWHLLICGNRPGEETRFLDLLAGHPALKNITFCGYRSDLPTLFPSCDLGLIGTTGWDSFPLSPLEMAASGLPVLASDLQGLTETVAHGETGYLFPPGDFKTLAKRMDELGTQPELMAQMSVAARARIVNGFSRNKQKTELEQTLRQIVS